MDGNGSTSLVPLPLPADHTILGPLAFPGLDHTADDDPANDTDLLALLWRCLLRLGWLFLHVLELLRQLRQQVRELRQQVGFWRAQHRRACDREAQLADEVQRLQGELRELKRRTFGRKSEAAATAKPPPPTAHTPTTATPKRSRGQQPGAKGPPRRSYDHLHTVHETCDLPPDQRCCPTCQLPFEAIPGTLDGDILEIDVRAYRRRYHRRRYRRCCQCPGTPAMITASPPPKVIPKGTIGISLWTMILQHKFDFFQPLHRVQAELTSNDLNLPAGTLTGGLQQITPLFEPLYQRLLEHNRQADHWHCDETRWHVFVPLPDKANFTWFLWVFATTESIAFILDPTRAHDVPEQHWGNASGIANVDRYTGYKATAQVKNGQVTLAFCWAHVRRDFLGAFTGWPALTDWAWSWLTAIGQLYDHNDHRLACAPDSPAYTAADETLRQHVAYMRQRCDSELTLPQVHPQQRKVLTSLREHWSGLTVFVDHPAVPLDNNWAERCQRGPVVARKNFYGSGALWSGRLAAMLFSLFQTVRLWGLDVGRWLGYYLQACAAAHGQPPPDPQLFLPWHMTPQQRDALGSPSRPPPAAAPSPAPSPAPPAAQPQGPPAPPAAAAVPSTATP